MVDTKSPGDKTLSVPTKTLTLKPRVETGTVRQSFSHGRTKQVVVEKRGKRRIGGDAPATEAPHAPEPVVAKAGQVVSGFSKVEGALQQDQAAALIHASDGAADGIRKLDAVVRQNAGNRDESREFPLICESNKRALIVSNVTA